MRTLSRLSAFALSALPLCALPSFAQTDINTTTTINSPIGGVVNIGNLNPTPFSVTLGAGGSLPGSVNLQNRARLINDTGAVGDLSVTGLGRADLEGTASASTAAIVLSQESVVNISGQHTIGSIRMLTAGNLNIAGGTFSGTPIRVNLRTNTTFYGTGLTLSGLVGSGVDAFGAYDNYQVSGTLLSGTVLNNYDVYRYFGGGNINLINSGGSQAAPMMPTQNSNGVFTFTNVPTMRWCDPPLTGAFDFAMTSGDMFTTLTLPVGIDGDNSLTISVGNDTIGTFSSGTTVNFADFGYQDGVSSFQVSGIDPLVDAANGDAFPIQLGFNRAFASFTMSAVSTTAPEPGTFALLTIAGGWFVVRRRKPSSCQ